MRIGLFVNRDIESNIALNLLRQILTSHQAFLFFSERVGKPGAKPKELENLEFFEQDLINQFIFPLIDSQPHHGGNEYLTFKEIEVKYGIPSRLVTNINDTETVEHIRALELDVIFSIRFGWIFKERIISIPKLGIINLHAGILPTYRGVLATFRAMLDDAPEIGCTLHYITDPTIDTGPIISSCRRRISTEKSMLWNIISLYPAGTGMLVEALRKLELGKGLSTIAQGQMEGEYFTFPTSEELATFRQKGYKVFDKNEYLELLRKYYKY